MTATTLQTVTSADGTTIAYDKLGSGPAVVLVSSSRPALVVAARGLASDALDAKALVKSLITRFGGKGGGRPELAQAGGLHGDPAEIGAASAEILKGG